MYNEWPELEKSVLIDLTAIIDATYKTMTPPHFVNMKFNHKWPTFVNRDNVRKMYKLH